MFGLLLRSIQAYVRATFGMVVWARILRAASHPADGFEPMLPYDQVVLDDLISACAAELDRPAEVILEDVGTFLVADQQHNALRRLLRFGGANFEEFLHSLEELPDRGRLAFPGLDLPQVGITRIGHGQFRLTLTGGFPALFPVLAGAVRAMADDYGALVLIDAERAGGNPDGRVLTVQLLAETHGSGRRFDLSLAEAADGR
jgi:Haem-NO-binding